MLATEIVLNDVLFSSLRRKVEFERKEAGLKTLKTGVMSNIALSAFFISKSW